jgi:hypothetical protein
MPQDVGATGQGRVAGKVGGVGWIASMAGRPLAHGFDGFRVGPRACGTWSHSGLLSGVWSERAPAVSSPGCSASSLTPAQTREAHRQHKPRGQCGLAGGIGHPIGLWARRMPRSTGGEGHERPPRSSPPRGALRCGSPRRTAMRAPGRTIPHVSSSHLSQTCALCWNPAIILQGAHKAMEQCSAVIRSGHTWPPRCSTPHCLSALTAGSAVAEARPTPSAPPPR